MKMAKMEKCPECRGKGVIPCPVDYGDDDHPSSCPSCAGNKRARVTCPLCDGEGKVEAR